MIVRALTQWGLPWLCCAAALSCADEAGPTEQRDAGSTACVDDRFGPSLPDLPAADLAPGAFTDLVLCPAQTDWFAIEAGPGFPITVRASGQRPLRRTLTDARGAVLATDEGASPRAAARGQSGLRVGVEAVDGALGRYALMIDGDAPADDCADGFEADEAAGAEVALGAGAVARVVCGDDVDRVALPPSATGDLVLEAMGTGATRVVLLDERRAPPLRWWSGTLLPGERASVRLASAASATLALRVRAVGDEPGVIQASLQATDPSPRAALTGVLGRAHRRVTAAGVEDAEPRPASGLLVDALDGAGALVDVAVVDAAGGFALSGPADDEITVRVRAEAAGPRTWIRVGPDADDHPWALPVAAVRGGGVGLDLTVPADAPTLGALHVAQTAAQGLEAAEPILPPAGADPPPPLVFRWQPDRAAACGTCFLPGAQPRVDLSGREADPDEWDDFIILHELGHYLATVYSRDDSPGGAHDGTPVAPALAWSEGWATFHAAWQLGSAQLLDAKASGVQILDVEALDDVRSRGTADGLLSGAVSEYLVAAVLWDLHDGPDDADADGVALAIERIASVLWGPLRRLTVDRGAPGVDLADFLGALLCADDAEPAWLAPATARDYPFEAEGACPGKPQPAVALERLGPWVVARARRPGLLVVRGGDGRAARPVGAGEALWWRPPAAAPWIDASLSHRGAVERVALRWASPRRDPLSFRVRAGAAEVSSLGDAARP